MAFGVDTTSHATAIGGGGNSITWAHTCGAGANKLVVTIGTGSSGLTDRTVSTVTYNGAACSKLGSADDGAFERHEIWRLNSPATGSSLNIVATLAGLGANQIAAGAISFNDSATAEGASSSNNASSTNPTVTVVDSANGDIVVSACSDDGSASATTEAGTLVWEDEDVGADSDFNCQRQVATGASTVCSWTNGTSAGWAAVGVAIKAAAGAAPFIPIVGRGPGMALAGNGGGLVS